MRCLVFHTNDITYSTQNRDISTRHQRGTKTFERSENIDRKYVIGENATPVRRLGGFCYWCVAASEWFDAKMVERGYRVCIMYNICLENQKGYYLRSRNTGGNAHAACYE